MYDPRDHLSAGQVFVSFRWVGGRISCRAMDADGACAESPAKKLRSEDGKSASNMDADSACAENLAKKLRSEDGECAAPLAASNRPLANHRSKWRHKPYRADRGQARKPRLAPMPPSLRTVSLDLSVERAAAPAKVFRKCEQNQGSVSVKTDQCIERLAARLAAGRSIAVLTQVMDVHLFSGEGYAKGAYAPERFVRTTWRGERVHHVSFRPIPRWASPCCTCRPRQVRRLFHSLVEERFHMPTR